MKKIILLISILALALGLFAVEVTIGTGTTYNGSSGSPAVYSGYYKNNREQFLITPGELNAAGGGTGDITSIAFNVYGLNSVGARPMIIKMGHTANAALTTTFVTDLTTVKTYTSYAPAVGWNVHTLDTAFPWNGTQSLVVEVFYGDIALAYTSNASTYYTTTSPTYRALYNRSDTVDANTATTGTQSYYRPNMQFQMAAYVPAVPGPAAIVSPLDAGTGVLPTATLNWAAGAGLPTGYKLYFGTSPSPAFVGDLGDVTTYEPGTLTINTQYYWQVVPYNGVGDAVDCPVWSFTTHTGQASLLSPADAAINVNITNALFTWTTAPGALEYIIQIGTASGLADVVSATATSPYTLVGPLAYSTPYYWSVYSVYPDARLQIQSVERMFTTMEDPLLSSFPWTENFGTLSTDPFPPIHWNKYSGLLADPTVLGDTGTGSWVQDDWLNVIDPANKAARMNVYGTSINGWLISRPIQMPGPGYQLEFDLALTDYFNSNPPEDPTGLSGVDDRFIVLIGDGTSWTPANVVREWNNSGSDDVYNNIPYTGAHVTIPLDSYTGVKYIAFYAESTVSNADNDLFVDNVMVRETPSVAEFNLIPDIANWDFGTLSINNAATKTFTISNTGGAALTFNSISVSGDYYSPNPAFDLSSIPAGQSRDFTVQFLPTIEGGPYTGNFDISFNRETRSVALSGSAIDPAISYAELPYSTGFEDAWTGSPAAPEPGWTVINSNSDSYTWRRGASYIDAHTGDWFAQGMGNTNDWMITPPLNTGSYLKLKWWDAVESATRPNSYKVLLSTTDTNPASFTTELADITCSSITWTEHNVSFDNTSGTAYIAFHQYASGSTVYDFGIDDLVIEELPLTPPLAPTLTYPLQLTGLPQAGFNLTWTPDPASGPVDYYIVYFWDDDSAIGDGPMWETSGTSFDPTQALTDQITYGYLDRWNWTVQAYSSAYPETEAFATESWFEIQDDPTIIVGPDTPWTEGFEGATFPPTNWTMNDADDDGENWFHYSYEGTAHTGLYSAASASWTESTYALEPDNWLITPPIAIPATGEYLVEYYVGAQDPEYPEEHYGFYVSSTGTAPADFTLLQEETLEDGDWHYRSQNLATYAGQTVRFAFRHFDSYDWFYMKIDDVTVRKVPETPILSISPEVWDFGTVQLLNPTTPKNFLLSNVGLDTIDILAGDIQLNQTGTDFVLVAENLPAALSGTTTYAFTVQFIPQSLGPKTATVTIEDNITRELHTITLSGECIEEPIASVIALQGTVEAQVNARLDWASIYGDPSQAGYVHWDDSIQRGNVGAGASPFHAVAKYGTEVTALATGKVLDGVMIHLAEVPEVVDTLKVWTGTDADLTPVTMVHQQAVSGLTIGWNYIALSTPIPVVGTEALYVGYHVTGIADTFPASTDGLAAVGGRGNVLELSGSWSTLTSGSIAGSWLIHAHFAEAAPTMAGRRPVALQNVAVNNVEMTDEALRNSPIEARMNSHIDRVIRGFNIYRDGLQINSEIVAAYTYLDEGLAADTYNYAVQAVHYSANGPISGTVPVTIAPPPDPIALPFTEDWASEDYGTNMWAAGSTNWVINSSTGNPAPSASFSWNPNVTDYSIVLGSYQFDATGIANVQFSFDLYLNNFSTDAENTMTWEIWDGTSWNNLGSYSSLNDDLDWTSYVYDITEYAANRVFKIRFVAAGEDSYEINYWYIDNIYLAELPTSVDPVTDLAVSIAGTDVTLSWTAVPEADWYYIYGSDDPYGTFVPLGFVTTVGTTLPLSSLPYTNKAFVKVTAGTGPLPAGRNLTAGPAKSK